jgi:hypothetical protein
MSRITMRDIIWTMQGSTHSAAASGSPPPPPPGRAPLRRATHSMSPLGQNGAPILKVFARQHCNIIEAPWLVNGGHGASFRQRDGDSPTFPLMSSAVRIMMIQRRKRRGISATASVRIMNYAARRPTHSASARVSTRSPGQLHCNMIEAPWLVNGGHGASLRHHRYLRRSCSQK